MPNKLIPVSAPFLGKKELEYVSDAIRSGWVSSIGRYIEKFEKRFADYSGTKYALTVSNGTAALHLALVSLGIKQGDEVIVPDLTFIATANAVAYTGAKPVIVDIEEDTWCIDPESIKKAITPKTRAIIPVHIYGHPCEMNQINKIAKKYRLWVIEDAAEAHGAKYKDKKVGGIGDLGCFSFYGNKIITTGEGGMIITNNKNIYERARFLRDQAMSREKRYWHPEIGYNYRLTNIQAALGLAQLKKIDEIIRMKRKIFNWYDNYLSNIKDLKLNIERKEAKNVFWMVCLIMGKFIGITRDELIIELRRRGIDSRPFFYPLSQMPAYRRQSVNPVARKISQRGLNLPSGANLKERDVRYICQQIRQILKRKA